MAFHRLKRISRSLNIPITISRRSFNNRTCLFANSYYDVLGVSKSASKKEIRAAYLKKTKQLHPDNNLNDETLHDKFTQVTQAYQILGDDILRSSYNSNPQMSNIYQNPMPSSNHRTKRNSTTSTNPFGEYDDPGCEWDESLKKKMYDEFYNTTYPEYLKQVNEDWIKRRRKNKLVFLVILSTALLLGFLNFSRILIYHQDYRKSVEKNTRQNAAYLSERGTGYRAYINSIGGVNGGSKQNKDEPS